MKKEKKTFICSIDLKEYEKKDIISINVPSEIPHKILVHKKYKDYYK